MKHNISRYLLTLVALFAMSAGAWAQTEWSTTSSLPTDAGNYKLTTDVSISSTWAAPSGETTIDLNGHGITMTSTSRRSVIKVASGCTLTIKDTNTSSTGGSNRPTGIEGGYITGGQGTSYSNWALVCGGGVFIQGGTFKLDGGTICGNSAGSDGGGVFVIEDGTFTMNGGYIKNNIGSGGGVCVGTNCPGPNGVGTPGTFIMNGGVISDNSDQSGEITSEVKDIRLILGKVELRGGKIIGNFCCDDKDANTIEIYSGFTSTSTDRCNFYIPKNESSPRVLTIKESLGTNVYGVRPFYYDNGTKYTYPQVFTSGLSGNGGVSNFESIDDACEVKQDANNEASLQVDPNAIQVTLSDNATEASFTMLAGDVNVSYELVRDITQKVNVEVRIDGTATERVPIAKDNEGHYKFVTKQEGSWQFAAVDKLDNNKDLTNGELTYTLKMKVGDQYEAKDFGTGLCPGTWRLEAEANASKPYEGIAYGKDIELYEQTNITFAKGYSTHYYSESLVLDEVQEGLKFYAVTDVTAEKVTLTEIEAKAIPAETPFIAYNAGAEAITAKMGILKADAVTNAAQFKGTAEDKTMEAKSGCYVLRNGDSTPTFRLVEGAGTLPAHRCWIDLGAASAARALDVEFNDNKTAISTIMVDIDNNGDWYDLQGRKRQGPPQRKGTYIHNGKTIIIK